MIVSYAQNYEDVMLWRALKQVECGFYIDVGANDPVVDSVTQLFYEQGWSGINIEPVASHWHDLQKSRLRDINLQCAAGECEGEIKLWECEVRGWASADEEVIAGHLVNGHAGQYTSIRQTTLNQVWQQYVPSDVHFLKVDVEGFEYSVLKGLDFQRFRPWIVVVEATRPNTTHEIHEQWEPLLVNANYLFVYADGLNRFYVAGERQALAGSFKYPPNFFDHFVQAPQLEGNLWAQTIATRAEQALAKAAQSLALAAEADARTAAALENIAQAEFKIDSMLKSTSWRMTLPVRLIGKGLTRLRPLMAQYAASSLHGLNTFQAQHLSFLTPLLALRKSRAYKALYPGANQQNKSSERSAVAHLAPRVLGLYKAVRQQWTSQADSSATSGVHTLGSRRRLAFVSPLPPARSGIADYSAELLPALAQFYDIDVILEPSVQAKACTGSQYRLRDSTWLLQNPSHYDRVLYHFGNSSHHQHMLSLLLQVPGVVVLHDFYLGDLLNYLEAYQVDAFACQRGLYLSHGYGALAKRSVPGQNIQATDHHPANFEVLQHALGVIVHSLHSKQLAATWYGASVAGNWSVIPLLRQPNNSIDRQAARQALGLQPDEFMICSFGLMGATKLNHRLLQAWLSAVRVRTTKCRLVFVGEEQVGDYGVQIRQAIQASGMEHSIQITGRADSARYVQYLMAADLAVQLRTSSRGETSAAVLDCLNYGLPTIVNAHGALAELPSTAVWMLADDFLASALTQAIDVLWSDDTRRRTLGLLGQECILSQHAPAVCAEQYRLAIERDYAAEIMRATQISQTLSSYQGNEPTDTQFIQMAQTLARNMRPLRASRQLLVDVSATCREDLQTGIQRVVRALVWSLIQAPPAGVRIEPVYLTCETGVWHYRYARKWTCQALGIADGWMPDEPVDCVDGDVLLIADFTSGMAVEASEAGVFAALKDCGVSIHFFVYDLLPLQMPQYFPPGQFGFPQWLQALTAVADSAICISRSVADDLQSWQLSLGSNRRKALAIDWFHLGADLVNSIPSKGLASNSNQVLAALQKAPSFLMVGTLEPRKGYLQTLQAFTQLWQAGFNINLVIVGREGWVGLQDDQRQTIPHIVNALRTHPELGKRLLWLDDVSDEYLSLIYGKCVCLIAASEGEGFGLPLIEAAQHALPILARDLPVFREVAGDHAFYFAGLQAKDLSCALQAWLTLHAENKQPSSLPIATLTWAQSTKRVLEILHC